MVGPVLAGLLAQKRVVRTQVRKPSGKGETWYDAWRTATNTEFLAAKIEEMGLMPAVEAQKAPETAETRPEPTRGVQEAEEFVAPNSSPEYDGLEDSKPWSRKASIWERSA
jgi:hypothetical protein